MINKTVMITVAGRPNAGKSTLTNRLTGDKVAIVSPKPQTTRTRICGVFTHNNTQVVLIDTPGFHKAKTRLGDYMIGIVKKSVADTDAVILMVLPETDIGKQEQALLEHIKNLKIPVVLAINKMDSINYEMVLPVIEAYSDYHEFDAIVPISAKTGLGVPELLNAINKYAKSGPLLFPEGVTTDQPEKQVVAEIIREKLLIYLNDEIPHGTAVEITRFAEHGDNDNIIIDVDALIFCEKQSHKGMIIGKKGEMLRKIGKSARVDIERFMGAKVFLQTWVKVKENWRDSIHMVKNFGYTE